MSSVTGIETVASVITAGVLSVGLYTQIKDRRRVIRLKQFDEGVKIADGIQSQLTIQVYTTKAIERCRLTREKKW
jgi:hypothetical protein